MPVSSGKAATMLFAADKEVRENYIFGASAALIVVIVIVVIAGTVLSELIYEKCLNFLAGAGFILIGAITLVRVSHPAEIDAPRPLYRSERPQPLIGSGLAFKRPLRYGHWNSNVCDSSQRGDPWIQTIYGSNCSRQRSRI